MLILDQWCPDWRQTATPGPWMDYCHAFERRSAVPKTYALQQTGSGNGNLRLEGFAIEIVLSFKEGDRVLHVNRLPDELYRELLLPNYRLDELNTARDLDRRVLVTKEFNAKLVTYSSNNAEELLASDTDNIEVRLPWHGTDTTVSLPKRYLSIVCLKAEPKLFTSPVKQREQRDRNRQIESQIEQSEVKYARI